MTPNPTNPTLPPLPPGWAWTTLDKTVDVLDRHRVPVNSEERAERIKGKSADQLYPYYGATGQVGWIDNYLFDEEIVLLGEDGAPFLDFGKNVAYFVWSKCWVNNHAHVLRGQTDKLDNRFLLHYLNIFDYHNYVTGTTRLKLNQARMRDIPIPLAPLAEQCRIVEAIEVLFTQLEAGVAALKQARRKVRRYRASVLKAACEGSLVPQNPADEPAAVLLRRIMAERKARWKGKGKYQEPAGPDTAGLPDLPEGWVWATVEQLGIVDEQAVLTGPFGSNLGRDDFISSGVPVLTIGCLAEQGIDLEKAFYIAEQKAVELERYRVRTGDLLFSRMASVGRAGLVTARCAGSVINYHLMRLRLDSSAVDPIYFISYVRGSRAVSDYIKEVNHGATRDGINTGQLMEMPVALPPLAEQQRIVAEVERRLSVAAALEQSIDATLKRAERLRQSILKRAFSGQLVPQDPTDEPASALLARIRRERAGASQGKQLGLGV